MNLLNIITAAYFISLIVMTFWTNIRPSFVNYWNKTEYLIKMQNQTRTEVDNIDIAMAVNQAVIAVLGTYSKNELVWTDEQILKIYLETH